MANAIHFKANHAKILEGLIWLAQQAPGIDHYHAVKIFFYADKKHLNRYGRPIFGDKYVAMDYGPVPSTALDFIHRNAAYVSDDMITKIDTALRIRQVEKTSCLNARREPALNDFSRTDITMLRESLKENLPKSFGQLVDDTHAERAWSHAWENRGNTKNPAMDVELLIDESEDREDILDYIRNTSKCLML